MIHKGDSSPGSTGSRSCNRFSRTPLSEAVAKHIDLSATRRESTHSGHQPICGDLRELPAFGGLCRDRSQFIRSLPRQCASFPGRSLPQEIPFLAADLCVRVKLRRKGPLFVHPSGAACYRIAHRSEWGARLSWLSQSQPFELARPFGRRIAQAGDANATGKASLDGGLDEGRSDEGHRDRHIDVTDAAFVARGNLLHLLCPGDDLVQPVPTSRDGLDQSGSSLHSNRTHLVS